MFITPGSTVQQAAQSGRLLDYVERATDLSITATSAGAADTWIDGNAVVYDGATRVKIEAFAAAADFTSNLILELYDGVTDLGRLVQTASGTGTDAVPLYGARILTPSAGSHTYHVKAWKSGGTSNISASPTYLPAWYAISTPNSTVSGAEIGYDEVTGNVTISSATESAGTLVVQGGTYTFDGSPVIMEFFCATVGPAVGDQAIFCLFEGATELCRIADYRLGTGGNPDAPVYARLRFTPTAGSHAYKVTATRGSANATCFAGTGSGGAGTYSPLFLRFTKV